MPNCPKCNNPVDAEAVRCPHCNEALKAFGHPGIPLYRASGETYLCDSCLYHEDDTCTFPQRPYAKSCTLYWDRSQPRPSEMNPPVYQLSGMAGFKAWCYRNRGLLIVFVIIAMSLWLALS